MLKRIIGLGVAATAVSMVEKRPFESKCTDGPGACGL